MYSKMQNRLGDLLKGLMECSPFVVDDDDLARFHVAHELGPDDVQRAGLRRQDPGFAQPSQDQRPDTVGIAQPDQFLLGDGEQGIGAFDLAQGIGHAVDDAPVFADGD